MGPDPPPLHLEPDEYINHASLFPFLSILTWSVRAVMHIDCVFDAPRAIRLRIYKSWQYPAGRFENQRDSIYLRL